MPGLVLTRTNCKTVITGNYIDNCSIEWTNEYAPEPDFANNSYSFGGLAITGNHFTVHNVLKDFAWISVKPYGAGHFIHGLSVTTMSFSSAVQRSAASRRSTRALPLDYGRMRNILFSGNNYNGVLDYVANPVQITHSQNSAQASWVVPVSKQLPFRAWAKNVDSLTEISKIVSGDGARLAEMPWVRTRQGAGKGSVQVEWSRPAKGSVVIRARMDEPG